MKHANVAIFVPHNGCPHQCSFCNQRSITGQSFQPTAQDVVRSIRVAMDSLGKDSAQAEIAFFGGSFTAIEQHYMLELLDAAYTYVKDNTFAGIRISTRPDAITREILDLLKLRGVTSIELGAQSMDDHVLALNQRGHTAWDVVNASKQIRQHGFSLGLQMMTGLYGSTPSTDYCTGEQIAELCPDTVRIYPTVVMKNTLLGDLYQSGVYKPMQLQESVALCASLLQLFAKHAIPVIRLGLHDTPELHAGMLAGAWHPAFRELCESALLLEKAFFLLKQQNIPQGKINVFVHPTCISKMIGQKKANLQRLKEKGYYAQVLSDACISEDTIRIKICR